MLWVEYKTDREAPISKVSTRGCNDVDDFIKKIKTESQLGIPKDSRITPNRPSGIIIHPTDSVSALIPGISPKSPLRVQILDASKPTSDEELTSFWNSLREITKRTSFYIFLVDPNFSQSV